MGAKAKKRRVTRPKPRCMNPDCRSRGERRQQYIRGLCEACDKAPRRLIAAGKTTWEEAEEEGRCLPSRSAGDRPCGSPISPGGRTPCTRSSRWRSGSRDPVLATASGPSQCVR